MRQAAQGRGLTISGAARMIRDQDYSEADLIVTMDDFNFSEVHKLMPDPSFKNKVRPFCDFVSSSDREVPDPYYGGPSGLRKFSIYWMMGATAYSIISKKNPPKFPSRLDERN